MRGRQAIGRLQQGVLTAIAAAALVLAGLQPADAAATTTLRGTVADDTGDAGALGGVAVGFLAADGSGSVSATTDAGGRFALAVVSGERGVVWAGVRPDAGHALFTASGTRYVRAVIGATRPTGAPAALATAAAVATAAAIAGAGPVGFRVQRSGSIAGADPLLAGRTGAAVVERGDGSVVQTLDADADAGGAFRSHGLVPGRYTLVLHPRSPYLPATLQHVVVTAGTATTASIPAFVRGATLTGVVRAGGAAAPNEPITVFAPDGSIFARTVTAADGSYTVGRLDTGAYSVVFGERFTTPTMGVAAADVLPSRRSVGVGTDRADVVLNPTLAQAAQISGTASGLVGGSVAVVAERADGTVVADTTAGPSGAYRLGGLRPGVPLRLVALTGGGAQQRFGTLDLTPVAGLQTAGAIDASATTPVLLSGAAKGVRSVTVRASAQLVGRAVVSGGRYAIDVVPGRYTVTATARGRVAAVTTTRVVGATTHTVHAGAKAAAASVTLTTRGTAAAPRTATIASAGGVTAVLAPATKGAALTLPDGTPGGSYAIVAASLTPPANDGPWWFAAPTKRVVLHGGATAALGTVALRVLGG